MKDLHSHLLFGIDDGCLDIEESIQLLKKMEEKGIKELILTPHYVESSKYNCNNKDKEKIFNEIKKKAFEENISIKLYLGNEVFISKHFLKLLKDKEIQTLNNSKYLLFEFPLVQVYRNDSDIINELVTHGYSPILAHPERYPKFQEQPNLVRDYLRSGVLLQGNVTSLFGKYGRKAEKTLKYFLKNGWISFLGSDTHHDVSFDCKKIEKKLLKITKNPEYVNDLLYNNFDKVIKNEEMGMNF